MMKFAKLLLFPISILYGIIIFSRNKFYDWGIFRSKRFDIPIISVGNLSVGGTGKTPHIEYLVRLLKNDFSIATLSRGYKRKTKGFLLATDESTSNDIGDEPQQYKQKFDNIHVAVDTDRCRGINNLLTNTPNLDIILLDDAFQHRAVKPGISILLTDFHNVFSGGFMLPTGTLREYISGAKRADVIVVTKTPKIFSPITRRRLIEEINPKEYQKIFFSYIKFKKPIPLHEGISAETKDRYFSILMLTGIANPYPLQEHLKGMCSEIESLTYPDHHMYSENDLLKIKQTYNDLFTQNKVIFTTEKDAMRLFDNSSFEIIKDLPIYYIPIEIEFHEKDKYEFDKLILDYVRKNK